jgi:hypothetical protein
VKKEKMWNILADAEVRGLLREHQCISHIVAMKSYNFREEIFFV